MSACMQTDKPLISIVMAVYHPRKDWLVEQLDSLNAQTYPNLELIVCDDGPDLPVEACIFSEHIKAFPFELVRNEENLGSNRTFERLTSMARGKYIAYCDQDDIWMPEKMKYLIAALEEVHATMAYCDLSVIDETGESLSASIKKLRPRLQYVKGTGLEGIYFFRNCTAGCSMLIRSEIAKCAIPFPEKTVCDQWLAILASLKGYIAFVNVPLVNYRLHRNNQTGVLKGVSCKADYREKRLVPLVERLTFYQRYTQPSPAFYDFIEGRLRGSVSVIWKYRMLSPKEAAFELAFNFMPNCVFRILVQILSEKTWKECGFFANLI